MFTKKIEFEFEVYSSIEELNAADAALLLKARATTSLAYAPYSNFNVGAAALLTDGNIVIGSNQENASYPVGICAERVLLSTAANLFPKTAIDTMAISYNSKNGKNAVPISPCGMCRQSLIEYENIVNHPIRIILSGMSGEIYIIARASMLLPLGFSDKNLK
ncbi:MAG: cytidine deaminase [Ferruginibacter sp.]